MEMKYMHLKEGASGVPSRVGMAKTGDAGGRGGGGMWMPGWKQC